jgi:serine phosphatase RsbU (regulator of sigma subunit)
LPGPFLGLAETTFPTQSAELRPGDKVLLGTDGTRPDGVPGPADDTRLRDAATRHHELTGQAFVDAVAGELLTHVNHDEDITLLCLERGI